MKSSAHSAAPARLGVESLECRALLSATHLLVEVPPAATAGDTVPVTVTALDASSHVVTDYTGTVQLSSSDHQALLPGSHTFTAADQGKYTFSVRLQTAGTPDVLARDTGSGTVLGSARVTLAPAAVDHFAVGVIPASSAGNTLSVTVIPRDAFGNTVTSYHGTAHFAITNGQTPPPDHTFTDAEQGVFTTRVTLDKAGPQTITVTGDGAVRGSGTVTVAPGQATHFDLTGSPRVPVGGLETVTVVARDVFGNVATGYRATAMLTVASQNGPGTVDPIPVLFTAAEAGTTTMDVTLASKGPATITVADHGTPTVSGSLGVTVGGATDNENYVEALYQDLLGRPADPAGLAGWGGLLDGGTGRDAVVRGIEGSAEYHADAVTALYQGLLGRAPDAAGLSTFVARMGGGLSLDGVAVALMGSDEYYQVRGGGTASGFVSAIYQDNLLRDPDPAGLSYFGGLLAQGHARADVAQQIMASPEADQLAVRNAYNTFLRRDADPAGLGTFVARRQQGMTTDDLFAALLSSDEYFHRAAA